MALALFRPARLRRRLWQGGIALALFIGTLGVGNFCVSAEKALDRRVLGQDFLAFYTAGTFVRQGRLDDLYNLDAVRDFQHQIARDAQIELGDAFGPYWNPPFYAWLFVPLSHLSFYHAVLVWTGVNALCLFASLILLCRMLPKDWELTQYSQGWFATGRDWKNWLLVPLLVIVSMPMIQALSHGQNTCMSLLIVCLVVTAWRARQAEFAGMACALLFYKPQLAAVLAAVLVINMGFRALAGLTFVGGVLLAVSSLTMPGSIDVYLHQLPLNVHWIQVEHSYLWERHVTLKALWRLMLQGHAAGEASRIVQGLTYVTGAFVGLLLFRAAIRSRRNADEPWSGETIAGSRDRLIAASIVSMPLLMPFYFDYDLLLLAVPGVLIASEALRVTERSHAEKWLARTFGVLFLWLMFNPAIARITQVNVTVILLSLLSIQLIARIRKQTQLGGDSVPVDLEQLAPIFRRAA